MTLLYLSKNNIIFNIFITFMKISDKEITVCGDTHG